MILVWYSDTVIILHGKSFQYIKLQNLIISELLKKETVFRDSLLLYFLITFEV